MDNFERHYHKMPNMQTCYECIEKAKINIPSDGDSEAIVAMYCAKDKAKRAYNEWMK